MAVRRWIVPVAGIAVMAGGIRWKLDERRGASEVLDQLRGGLNQIRQAVAHPLPEQSPADRKAEAEAD
jgi:hypothetical protein